MRLILSEEEPGEVVGKMRGNWALRPGDAEAVTRLLAERGHETEMTERWLLPRPLLLWVDLETLGLDVPHTPVVEIACILTDAHLHELWRYETIIETPEMGQLLYAEQNARERPDMYRLTSDEEAVWRMHSESGLIAAYRAGPQATNRWPHRDEVEGIILGALHQWETEPRKVHMAGGGIAQFDQPILKAQMPALAAQFLHYRPVDVSVVETALAAAASIGFTKGNRGTPHRAMPDIEHTLAKASAAWWVLGQLRALPALVDALRFAARIGVCGCRAPGTEGEGSITSECPLHHDDRAIRDHADKALAPLHHGAPFGHVHWQEAWRSITEDTRRYVDHTRPPSNAASIQVDNSPQCTCPASPVAPGVYKSTLDQQGDNPACPVHGHCRASRSGPFAESFGGPGYTLTCDRPPHLVGDAHHDAATGATWGAEVPPVCTCGPGLKWEEHSHPDIKTRGHWEGAAIDCPLHGCTCPTPPPDGKCGPIIDADCPHHGTRQAPSGTVGG